MSLTFVIFYIRSADTGIMQLMSGVDTWTVEDLKNLPLLGACTDESMRRKPVGPVIIRKVGVT